MKTMKKKIQNFWIYPYLCPFCVDMQDEFTGECHCDCHTDKHIKAYYEQIQESWEEAKK